VNWGTEFRATAVALAAVFCLSSIGYRVLTAPTVPDLAPTVAQANTVLTHVQSASDAATGLLQAATGTVKAATPAVSGLAVTEGKINAVVDLTSHRINDLCGPDAPCGTLADVNRTLATLRGTSGQVERSLIVFNQHEGDLFTQESAAYSAMDKSVLDFDATVSDPDLKANIHNSATITGNFAAITTDGKTWVHQQLFPTKKKGFVAGFEATGDVAKHWIPSLF
jgi:hypothetical protein